uniref:VWFA domain-containing protein n=1 Tax=Crocodylus porosus TaxID=8502 RepID=A0A7M4EDN9_CROPO
LRGVIMWPPPPMLLRWPEKSAHMPADIYFLIDGSGSVMPNDFQDMKAFMNEMIDVFQVGADRVRFGVVQYENIPRTQFEIGQYNTVVQLKAAVRAIQQMGGGTKTGDALKYMKNLFAKATRTNVPQILIVITDGKSQDAVTSPAEELRQEGIIIYAIGIKQAVQEELKDIARSEDRVFFVNDFDSLKRIKCSESKAVCKPVPLHSSGTHGPAHGSHIVRGSPSLGFLLTSVNVNNLQFRANNPAFYFQCKVFANVCSMFFYFPACENVKADIIFLVDGSESIHPVDFQKMKDFMQLIVNRSDIGTDKVRIGLLQFSSEAKEEFQLNRYSTKTGLRRAISEIRQLKSGTLTGKALAFAASYFDKTKGGRPEIKQYLIVITDGEAQDSVGEPAKMIRDKGIIIYAIGVLQANETQLVEISGTPGKVYNLAAVAKSLKLDGINIFVVGVDRASRTELEQIVGEQERVLFAPSYSDLESLHGNLAHKICEKSRPGN